MVICNSFHEAETGALKLFPDILAIGPLFADQAFQKPVGHFLPEDEMCIRYGAGWTRSPTDPSCRWPSAA